MNLILDTCTIISAGSTKKEENVCSKISREILCSIYFSNHSLCVCDELYDEYNQINNPRHLWIQVCFRLVSQQRFIRIGDVQNKDDRNLICNYCRETFHKSQYDFYWRDIEKDLHLIEAANHESSDKIIISNEKTFLRKLKGIFQLIESSEINDKYHPLIWIHPKLTDEPNAQQINDQIIMWLSACDLSDNVCQCWKLKKIINDV